MKNVFKKYLWLFEWIGAAIIIAVGLTVGFVNGIVLIATGISLILIALLRVVPLFKTLKDKTMRWINAAEILINVVIGLVIIYISVNAINSGQTTELGNLFGYLLGAILYIRALIYFFGTSIKHELTDRTKFISHIIFMTLGTWFIARPTDEKTMGYFVLAIAILCALYVIIDGIKNYNNYRHEYAAEIELKKIQKAAKKGMEAPNKENKTDEIKEPTQIIEPLVDKDIPHEKEIEESDNAQIQ